MVGRPATVVGVDDITIDDEGKRQNMTLICFDVIYSSEKQRTKG